MGLALILALAAGACHRGHKEPAKPVFVNPSGELGYATMLDLVAETKELAASGQDVSHECFIILMDVKGLSYERDETVVANVEAAQRLCARDVPIATIHRLLSAKDAPKPACAPINEAVSTLTQSPYQSEPAVQAALDRARAACPD